MNDNKIVIHNYNRRSDHGPAPSYGNEPKKTYLDNYDCVNRESTGPIESAEEFFLAFTKDAIEKKTAAKTQEDDAMLDDPISQQMLRMAGA